MADPYVYPRTNVLKNKEGLRQPSAAERLERLMTAERMRSAIRATEKGGFKAEISSAGYLAMHRHIFQDVYEWAGQVRTVDIAKQNLFCRQQFITRELSRRFALINAEKNLQGLTLKQFADRAAEHIGEINAIHPFREGNGRTQRLFLKTLAHQAGHKLSLARIDPASWHRASVESFHGKTETMRFIIEGALTGQHRDEKMEQQSIAARETPPTAEKQTWKERREKVTEQRGQKRGMSRGYRYTRDDR